jgi:hypothetical protein
LRNDDFSGVARETQTSMTAPLTGSGILVSKRQKVKPYFLPG